MQCFHLLCQYRRKSRIRQKPPHHIHPFIPVLNVLEDFSPMFIRKPAADFPSHLQFQRSLNIDSGALLCMSHQNSCFHTSQVRLCKLVQICICIILYINPGPGSGLPDLPHVFGDFPFFLRIFPFHQIHHLVHLRFAPIVAQKVFSFWRNESANPLFSSTKTAVSMNGSLKYSPDPWKCHNKSLPHNGFFPPVLPVPDSE